MSGFSPTSASRVPNVIVASDDLLLLDEVVRHLEEIPQWHLSGSARSVEEFQQSVEINRPDAVLVSSALARELAGRDIKQPARLIVFGREEDTETLRACIRLEAKGFVLWPSDRRSIRALVERGLMRTASERRARGSLTCIWAPKGGAGATILAAHLASVLAGLGVSTLLADLDLDHADQSAVLGAEREKKTILDLMRVIEEATPSVVDSLAWSHPDGFRAILSPGAPGEAGLMKLADITRALSLLKESADHVIADLPSGFGEIVFAAAEESTRILLIVTPDLLSLRRAKSARRSFDSAGIDSAKIEVVLNQSGGREITARDVSAVLGTQVVAEIRGDLALLRASDRGEISTRGRMLVEPLARRIAGLPQIAPRGLSSVLKGR